MSKQRAGSSLQCPSTWEICGALEPPGSITVEGAFDPSVVVDLVNLADMEDVHDVAVVTVDEEGLVGVLVAVVDLAALEGTMEGTAVRVDIATRREEMVIHMAARAVYEGVMQGLAELAGFVEAGTTTLVRDTGMTTTMAMKKASLAATANLLRCIEWYAVGM